MPISPDILQTISANEIGPFIDAATETGSMPDPPVQITPCITRYVLFKCPDKKLQTPNCHHCTQFAHLDQKALIQLVPGTATQSVDPLRRQVTTTITTPTGKELSIVHSGTPVTPNQNWGGGMVQVSLK